MANANVQINFLDENGNPSQCKRLVISDGNTKHEFENVNQINESVPTEASYRFVWSSGGYDTMEQLNLNLNAGQNYQFNFYCLDRSQTIQQQKSYVLLEEVGADASTTDEWNESDKKLDISVTANEDKIVDVVVWIDTLLTNRPNHTLLSASTAVDGYDASVCFPPNINFTVSWSAILGSVTASMQFAGIPDTKTLVDIRRAIYNGFIINENVGKIEAELKTIDGNQVSSDYLYPQFAVQPGKYHIKSTSLPNDFGAITLPIEVVDGKASIYEYYPPKKSELSSYEFKIAAEYYHARANVTSVNHDSGAKKITAEVEVNGDNTYSVAFFGYFVLPASESPTNIKVVLGDGSEQTLTQNDDYVIEQISNFNVVTLRVPISANKAIIEY